MTMKLRAEEVEAAQHAAERDALHDEADAVVRVVGRRRVEDGEQDTGHQLHGQQEQHDAAGDEPPADAARQRLVEQVLQQGAEACSGIQPVAHGSS